MSRIIDAVSKLHYTSNGPGRDVQALATLNGDDRSHAVTVERPGNCDYLARLLANDDSRRSMRLGGGTGVAWRRGRMNVVITHNYRVTRETREASEWCAKKGSVHNVEMYRERSDGAPGIMRLIHRWPLSPKMLLALLPESQQQVIKARARKLRAQVFNRIYAYDAKQLTAKLRRLGIGESDAIMMQSSFDNLNGFAGDAADVIDCVLNIIGPGGHLFMVSMPYGGAARDYLREAKPFDVRRTPSHMGFLSELFRRRKGVVRSANPMHPVLAWGPRAEWIVEGHEDLTYSCGENSPFEKMLELDTKALLFDVDLDVLTFAHYLEHVFRDTAPARVYSDEPIETEIIDRSGTRRRVVVYPFAPEAMKLRNFGVLYDELLAQNRVHEARIGNTDLRLVRLRDVLTCCAELVDHGSHIFAQPGQATHIKPRRVRGIRRLFRRR